MKLYCGKNKKQAKEITLEGLFYRLLMNLGNESFTNRGNLDTHTWIEISKETNKPSLVKVTFMFDKNKNGVLSDLQIHEADIITIVDEENERLILDV